MSAECIVFGYSWPELFAIATFLGEQGFITTKIYRDEQKLLEALHHNPFINLVLDASPHRSIMLIAAIATMSCSRAVFMTARKIHLNDIVVAEFYFDERKCLTHTQLLSRTKEEIENLMRSERSSVCLSPTVLRPRIMNIIYSKDALYKTLQARIYYRLYLLGATQNEIDTLKLLISGLSIREIAEIKKVQSKTIYGYKTQLAGKVSLRASSRELIRGLSVGDSSQENGCLKCVYDARCNSKENRCAMCPFCRFCYEIDDDVNILPSNLYE